MFALNPTKSIQLKRIIKPNKCAHALLGQISGGFAGVHVGQAYGKARSAKNLKSMKRITRVELENAELRQRFFVKFSWLGKQWVGAFSFWARLAWFSAELYDGRRVINCGFASERKQCWKLIIKSLHNGGYQLLVSVRALAVTVVAPFQRSG